VTSESEVELSVIVPVYREAANIQPFLERLLPVVERNVGSFEVTFAVDPAGDDTEIAIRQARAAVPDIKLVVFSRRFGQPTATLAGLEFARGNVTVVMDVDLQDPPELIPEMLDRWREGFEVVYAQRRGRDGEPRVKRVVANVYYRVLNRLSEVEIPRNTGDFRLMDRRVVDALLRFPETHGFLRGIVALVGFRQTAVEFDRPPRHAGRGNYNRFFGSTKIGLNGLVGFSSALLSLSALVGLIAVVASFMLGAAYVATQIMDEPFPGGSPTTVLLILFIGGAQLICLGIASQYIGRIYDEVKRRPRYIVDVAEGFVDTGPPSAEGRGNPR
jgi:glycosyltransferase involved in cell wall biosynthesis